MRPGSSLPDRDASPFPPAELQHVGAVGDGSAGVDDHLSVAADPALLDRAAGGALRIRQTGRDQRVRPSRAGRQLELRDVGGLVVVLVDPVELRLGRRAGAGAVVQVGDRAGDESLGRVGEQRAARELAS